MTNLDIKKEIQSHLKIFGILILLTILNVFAGYKLHQAGFPTVFFVLLTALVQGFLVICYFMHLISEQKFIHMVLILTIVFFAGLILLPIYGAHDIIFGSNHVP